MLGKVKYLLSIINIDNKYYYPLLSLDPFGVRQILWGTLAALCSRLILRV